MDRKPGLSFKTWKGVAWAITFSVLLLGAVLWLLFGCAEAKPSPPKGPTPLEMAPPAWWGSATSSSDFIGPPPPPVTSPPILSALPSSFDIFGFEGLASVAGSGAPYLGFGAASGRVFHLQLAPYQEAHLQGLPWEGGNWRVYFLFRPLPEPQNPKIGLAMDRYLPYLPALDLVFGRWHGGIPTQSADLLPGHFQDVPGNPGLKRAEIDLSTAVGTFPQVGQVLLIHRPAIGEDRAQLSFPWIIW